VRRESVSGASTPELTTEIEDAAVTAVPRPAVADDDEAAPAAAAAEEEEEEEEDAEEEEEDAEEAVDADGAAEETFTCAG
jgi:hypothetical protein